LYGDIIQLEGTCNDAGDEFCYVENTTPSFTTTSYNKYVLRYKTSVAEEGLSAYALIEFDDATTQTILASGTFSTRWAYTSGTITASKTVDKIRLYAQDNPNSVDSGTYQVWYDFILLCENIFTFPKVHQDGRTGGLELRVEPRYADIEIPGRVGDISQYLGMSSPSITLSGDMGSGIGWGTPYGKNLYEVALEACTDPCQWFTSDLVNCKVTPRPLVIEEVPGKTKRVWSWELRHHSLSRGSESTWNDRQWLGL